MRAESLARFAGAAPDASTRRIALDARSRRWTLVAVAACLLPLLLQISISTAVAIAVVGSAIALLAWRRVIPVWIKAAVAIALVGSVLVTTRFSFGRDTGCALLAAMLAIKPIELTTVRDARSLLGFALFAPFATFLLDQGPGSLLLGLLGAILVLIALLRLADVQAGDDDRATSLWRRGLTVARLIAIGLPLAIAAFYLFPRIASPLWGVPERALARPGLSDRMSPGDWIDLMGDDTPALRATFFGDVPPTSQMYWRGPVLWNFDGRTWTQPRAMRDLPAAAMTASASAWDYELQIEPTDRRQLVALDLPTAAPEGAQLSRDYGLYAARPLSALTRWHLRSSPPTTFEVSLSPAMRDLALRLPEGFNPRTLALARAWRREAGPSDAAIVDRFLTWVRRDFAYTLTTPLLGRHSVDEFLFEQKAGFCEHFSSSFVVTMRAAGIPARVVTGFAGGYRNRYGQYWVVRRSDAHAWAEVWLRGRGWIRVDPTAAVAPDRIYDTLDDRAQAGGGGLAPVWFAPVWDAGDWLRHGWNDMLLGFDAARQQQLLKPLGIERLESGQLIALFAAIGGLALAAMLWLTTRGERERDPLLRAWHRLTARYAKLGLERAAHEPATEWAARVTAGRADTGDLVPLSARFADWRYAPHAMRGHQGLRILVRDLRRHRP